MTSWIFLAVIAQFFYAVTSLLDKYIVTSGKIAKPAKFAFYVGLLSSLTLLVFLFGWIDLPFENVKIPSYSNVSTPSFKIIILSLVSAGAFLGALVSLYTALKKADASDVIPVVGSASVVSSLLLSSIFLGVSLTINFLIGAIVLAAGSLLVSLFHFGKKVLILSLGSGLLFGIHYTFIKLVFNETVFDDGFFWTRMAIALLSFFLLFFIKRDKKVVLTESKSKRKTEIGWVLLDKGMAGIAGILSLKAIELGSVTVVQALGSLQFAFLLIFAIFWGNKTPYACGENCTPFQRVQKFISVFVIMLGFIILFL